MRAAKIFGSLLLLATIAHGPATAVPMPNAAAGERLVELVNSHRAASGLPRLQRVPAMDALAVRKAQVVLDAGRIFHDSRWLRREANAALPSWKRLGENLGIAWAAPDGGPEAAVEALHGSFLTSRSHRAIVEGPAWDSVGVAVLSASDGKAYVVEYFAKLCGRHPGRGMVCPSGSAG